MDTMSPVAGTRPDLAQEFARFAALVGKGGLDPAVAEAARINIFDTLACAFAGSSAHAIEPVVDMVQSWGGAPQADIWVYGGKYPAHNAAFVNGGMAHARDYDDTHDSAVLHAGVSAVPAAIAAAQMQGGISGADLIAAVAAGLEITCRLGLAIKATIIESGFIYTPLLGYFGATAAAGRAMGLSEEQMLNAFGIVYSSVSGNHQVTRDASVMKRLQPGLAAQGGVVAAQMAARGIRGAQAVFEGVDGFFRVYFNNKVDGDLVRSGLGQRWDLLDLSYKPYPCCRANHTAVDATLRLRGQAARPAEDIEEIRVGVTAQGYQIVCTPEEMRRQPKTVVQAQFSIPFTVASSWIDGKLGLSNFTDEGVARKDVLALAARVKPYVDEQLNRERSRGVTQAKVEIRFRDGTSVNARVDDALGHPNNPMSREDFIAKADDCAAVAARKLAPGAVKRLAAAVDTLEQAPDITALAAAMV